MLPNAANARDSLLLNGQARGRNGCPDAIGRRGAEKVLLAVFSSSRQLSQNLGLAADPILAYNNGYALYQLHRYPAALREDDKAARLSKEQGVPENPGLAWAIGCVYYVHGRYPDAVLAYRKAQDLRRAQGLPDDADLAANLQAANAEVRVREQNLWQ